MSRISNEWVRLEMREGVFKDKSPRPGRVLFFLCLFILLFLWSVPVSAAIHADRDEAGSRNGKVPMLTHGGVDKSVLLWRLSCGYCVGLFLEMGVTHK